MKSIFNYIALSVLVLFLATSCENDADIHTFPDPDINFSFRDTYTSDYFIWSDIQFTNSSVKKGSPTWDFGDGTTSNEENPIHSYNEPGVYNVKLTLDGVGTLSKKLYISDIKVVANYTSTDSTVEIKKSPVVLDVYLPNPKDSIESYEWIFPEGTLDENGNPISSSLEKDPGVLKFKNVGSQTITLKTKLGTRVLPNREVNIQVGYDTPVKTLYYAVKDGKINALKIIKTLPSDVQNKPYILNASSGQNSLCILFHDSLLYVLDAGFKATWQDDSFGIMGDGKITVVSKDGLTTEVMLDNTGGAANDDPFYGYIDGNTFLCFG
ncbi:MAG: PKD domain-containing protein [Dysgonomonas sp.]